MAGAGNLRDDSFAASGADTAGKPFRNKSLAALHAFRTAIREKRDGMTNLISAISMEEDEGITHSVVLSSNEDDFEAPAFSWDEFCSLHSLNGDRLKYTLEPLMDLETPLVNQADGSQESLRHFARYNWVLAIGMLIGDGAWNCDNVIRVWFKCSIFLARHLDHHVPFCMRVVDADEVDRSP